MVRSLIPFDTGKHHIYINFELIDHKGIIRSGLGILDTGATRTEFSDLFLIHADMYEIPDIQIQIPENQQSKNTIN